MRGLEQHPGRGRTDLRRGPTHDTSQGDCAPVISDDEVAAVQHPVLPVQGDEPLGSISAAHDDAALQRVGVEGVQGVAELQHHVVGDVDREADGSHAGQHEPPLQPGRGGSGGVEPLDHRGDVAVAPGVGELHRRPTTGRRHVTQAEVVEGQAERGRGLAGDAADAEGVTAVRGDGDVEHLVTQVQELDDIAAQRRVRVEHEDPGGGVRQPQLGLAADHPVAGPAVGLPGRDPKPAGQARPGQGEGDDVAGREVLRAADDLVHTGADVDVAEADGLLRQELGQLLDVEDPADDDLLYVITVAVDLLHLKACPHQGGRDLVGRGGQLGHEGAEPGQGDAHVRPPSRRRG